MAEPARTRLHRAGEGVPAPEDMAQAKVPLVSSRRGSTAGMPGLRRHSAGRYRTSAAVARTRPFRREHYLTRAARREHVRAQAVVDSSAAVAVQPDPMGPKRWKPRPGWGD